MIQKLRIMLLFTIIIGVSSQVFATNVTELSLGGTQAKAVNDKWGLNVNATWWNEFNYMFAVGFNPSFAWFKWDKYVLDQDGDRLTVEKTIGGVTNDYPVKETANAYLIPLHLVARVQMPLGDTFIPFIKGGGGYTFMPLSYSNADNEYFSGITWTAGVGCAFRVQDIPNFRFFIEADYRGAEISNSDNVTIDMSGFIFQAGVQYGLTREKASSGNNGIIW